MTIAKPRREGGRVIEWQAVKTIQAICEIVKKCLPPSAKVHTLSPWKQFSQVSSTKSQPLERMHLWWDSRKENHSQLGSLRQSLKHWFPLSAFSSAMTGPIHEPSCKSEDLRKGLSGLQLSWFLTLSHAYLIFCLVKIRRLQVKSKWRTN